MLTEYKFKIDLPYHRFPETVDGYFAKYENKIVDCFTISDDLQIVKTTGCVAKPNSLGYPYYDRDDDMCLWVQETKHGRTYWKMRWWTTDENLIKDMLNKELMRYLTELSALQDIVYKEYSKK